jgi:hypothetical protein
MIAAYWVQTKPVVGGNPGHGWLPRPRRPRVPHFPQMSQAECGKPSLVSTAMPFSRRKDRRREQAKVDSRDPFAHLQDERAKAEEEEPWFLAPDDGPELEIETGISSNLTPDDLQDLKDLNDAPDR